MSVVDRHAMHVQAEGEQVKFRQLTFTIYFIEVLFALFPPSLFGASEVGVGVGKWKVIKMRMATM